ncbi:MAG: ribosome maturation factor RimM [Chloroflexota bacterium]
MTDQQTNSIPRYLLLGEILRPHGVRGEVRMRVLTDYPERIAELDHVYLGRGPDDTKAESVRVADMRMHKGYGLVRFKGVTNRNDAELLRGLYVMVRTEDAVPLDEDEVYLYQLIGMTVRTEDGAELGTLVEVLETGANDVYIVQSKRYGEVLIPAIDETIIETDTDSNTMTVSLPEGLLPG